MADETAAGTSRARARILEPTILNYLAVRVLFCPVPTRETFSQFISSPIIDHFIIAVSIGPTGNGERKPYPRTILNPQLPVDRRVQIVRAQSRSVGNETAARKTSTRSPASTVN
jgi:hypothetical protein